MKRQIYRLLGSVSTPCAVLLTLSLVLASTAAGHAQTTPAYVVSSLTNVTSVAGQSITNGAAGNYAVNSRGDFFLNDGAGHVVEYPATGGAPIVLFTMPSSAYLGPSGVAVDPSNDLYVTFATYNGPSGANDSDSLVYEFPYTNGGYPAPYTYTIGVHPPICSAGGTQVCSAGFYEAAADYYWIPLGIAADGLGDTFMYTVQDNAYGTGSLGIFKCNLACNEELVGANATDYTVTLPKSITSIAADYAGDVYFTDEQNVYVIPAGSPATGNTPQVFDSSYNQPYGVTIDQSGNLYVSDMAGIWKVPAVETSGGAPCKGGSDSCTLSAAAKYLVVPVTLPTLGYAYGNQQTYMGAAVDNRGDVFFNTGMPAHNSPVPVDKAALWSGAFPPTAAGATAASSLTFNIAFNAATTIKSIAAVQGGAPATEFTVNPGNCAPGSFGASATCSFSVSFTPSAVGVRTGAILITDSTGATTTTLLSGVGTGSAVAVDPGTVRAIGSGFKTPAGIAIDGAGNLYVADPGAGTVQEYPAGGGAPIGIGANLSVPTSVAVDAAGDVYILNQGTGNTASAGTGSVIEVPDVAGTLDNSAQKTLLSGLNTPADLVLDSLGNMYISLSGSNTVVQAASAALVGSDQALVPLGYGLNAPTGVAVDSSGNVYVADTGNSRVVEIGDGFQTSVGSGLTAPTGVAVDPSGSVMIADGSGRILRVPNENNPAAPVGLNQADQQVLASPLDSPYSIRMDSAGNLYASDMQTAQVDELVRGTGAIDFGDWNLNTVSDTQPIVLSNIGDTTIMLGSPLFTAIPAATGFSVVAGTGSTGCASGSLYSGYSCDLDATFSPTAAGPSTYPLVLSAPAQNNSAPSVTLTGDGVSEGSVTVTLEQTAPTGTVTYGEPITITANVVPASGTVAPTGYVVFTFDGQAETPIALKSAAGSTTASAVLMLPAQNAGNNTVSAYYEGDSNYAEMESAALPIDITLASSTNVLTVVGDSAEPLSAAPDSALVMTDVLTPSVPGLFTGTVTFANTLTPNAPPLAVVTLGNANADGTYTATFTYQNLTSGLTPGNYNIVATYSGNSNYTGGSSAAISAVITNPTFALTTSANAVTSSQNNYGEIKVTISDYSNFQGGVVLNCTGLPANAYCVFRPISAQLEPAASVTPNTIYPVTSVLQIQVDQSQDVVEGALGWIGMLFSLGLLATRRRLMRAGRFRIAAGCLIVLVLGGTAGLSGCGGGSSGPSTPAGTYKVIVTGTATGVTSTGQAPACSGTAPGCVPDLVQQAAITLTVK